MSRPEDMHSSGLERSDKTRFGIGLAPSTRVEPAATGARCRDQKECTHSGLERSDKIQIRALRARAVHARRARCQQEHEVATRRIALKRFGAKRQDPDSCIKGSRRPRASSPLQQEHDVATRRIALKAGWSEATRKRATLLSHAPATEAHFRIRSPVPDLGQYLARHPRCRRLGTAD